MVLPNHLQQTGWQELDFADLSFSSRHKYQDMQVQSSREIEVPLMQLNSWKCREVPENYAYKKIWQSIDKKKIEKQTKGKLH